MLIEYMRFVGLGMASMWGVTWSAICIVREIFLKESMRLSQSANRESDEVVDIIAVSEGVRRTALSEKSNKRLDS
jgi:hypothetical protein